jgi:phosphoglycolate phosphatase
MMPRLEAAGIARNIALVVFDKDGTLLDFDRLWTGKLKTGLDAVVQAARRPEIAGPMAATLGLDVETTRVIPESPLAVATVATLGMACAVVLHQHGFPWHEAERLTQAHFLPAIHCDPLPGDVLPIAVPAEVLSRLRQAGMRVAVFTSDDRKPTLASLRSLGVADLVEAMVCGDDPIPGKPAGDGLMHLCGLLGVAPGQTAMVGDSVTDMRAAAAAGVGFRIGVLSGTGERAAFAAAADAVIPDISHLLIG